MTHLFNRMFRFVLCGLVLLGTLQAFAATTEVVDAIGRKVRITTPVQRVVLNFNFEEFTAVAGKESGRHLARALGGLAPGDFQTLFGSDTQFAGHARYRQLR